MNKWKRKLSDTSSETSSPHISRVQVRARQWGEGGICSASHVGSSHLAEVRRGEGAYLPPTYYLREYYIQPGNLIEINMVDNQICAFISCCWFHLVSCTHTASLFQSLTHRCEQDAKQNVEIDLPIWWTMTSPPIACSKFHIFQCYVMP